MTRSANVWAQYAERTAGREPMQFLDVAMDVTDGERGNGRLAIDLGCGAGNEALALLERGWLVHAVDAEGKAIEILSARVPDELAPGLTTDVGRFHEAKLPRADLVFASLSLPFAADRMRESIEAAVEAVAESGWFVGVLLGHEDTWANDSDVATVGSNDIQELFSGLDIESIDESEFDGPSGSGPKHWHWYVVAARRPSDIRTS